MTGSSPLKLLLSFLSLVLPVPLLAATSITDNLHLQCADETVNRQVNCQYRQVNPEIISSIKARNGQQDLKLEKRETWPGTDDKSAIIFMVDTSDPAREAVIRQNRKDIETILSFARPHHVFALARFDKGFHVEAAMGTPVPQIVDRLDQLHAVGKITELYRSMLSAINLLEQTTADRKAIYLFSDGLAEDKAYYHDDVVKAAISAGVVINSLGYPRSVTRSVALQTIRRLSEETGGRYVETDNNYRLPDAFISNPFATIDNGGTFSLDISPLIKGEAKNVPVYIEITTAAAQHGSVIQLPVPASPAAVSDAKTPASAAPRQESTSRQASQPVQVITRETDAVPINKWFWYGIPAILIVLLILTIAIFLVSTYRQGHKKSESSASSEFKPYAYLVLQDETKRRYAITRTTWRIGRGRDNEMTLPDSSVSRRHAEIHREKGDLFTIYDLDSLNGIYINNNKVSKSLLHEGDIIEIGDINLRFTLLSTDYSVEESTIMQNTRTPLH